MPFQPRTLGRTGLTVGPIGLASSYGAPAETVPWAFDLGVRYFYWGSIRRNRFAKGLGELGSKRDQYALVIQTYSRIAALIPGSLERALRSVQNDYADVVLLGLWNHPPPARILDACLKLKDRGLVRHIALSTHKRPLIPELSPSSPYEIFHVRYNAVHRGAEREVFQMLPEQNRPGIVSFTATSWKQLLDGKRTPPGERTPTASDCYRFVLSNAAVDVCMAAPATSAESKDIARAVEQGPMTAEELAWMNRVGKAIYQGKIPG
jgi:aryl-alcohol dehydrogenase-like predicted oxidoreductase